MYFINRWSDPCNNLLQLLPLLSAQATLQVLTRELGLRFLRYDKQSDNLLVVKFVKATALQTQLS